jgi:hypothetical protein
MLLILPSDGLLPGGLPNIGITNVPLQITGINSKIFIILLKKPCQGVTLLKQFITSNI